MKNTLRILIAVLSLVVVVLVSADLSGCAGQKVRDAAGVPALLLATDSIVEEARAGLLTLPDDARAEAAPKVDAFAAALSSKDRQTIALDGLPLWIVVRPLAEAGISARLQRREIGPGVAASLRERLDRYDEVLAKVGSFQ